MISRGVICKLESVMNIHNSGYILLRETEET